MKKEEIKDIVAEAMAFPDSNFSDDVCFRDVNGYDSVNMLIMLVDLEDRAGIHIPSDRAGHIKSFANIIEIAKEQKVLD